MSNRANIFRAPTNAVRKVVSFYVDGFRSMTVGRTLWIVILVKLFIMFAILKVFFSRISFRATSTATRSVRRTCVTS